MTCQKSLGLCPDAFGGIVLQFSLGSEHAPANQPLEPDNLHPPWFFSLFTEKAKGRIAIALFFGKKDSKNEEDLTSTISLLGKRTNWETTQDCDHDCFFCSFFFLYFLFAADAQRRLSNDCNTDLDNWSSTTDVSVFWRKYNEAISWMVLIFRICDKGWNDLFLCPLLFRTACISNAFLLVARLFKIRRRKIYSVLSISVSISFALPSFLYFRSQFQSSLFHLLFSCVYLKSLKQGCLSSKENILCQNSCVVGPSLSEASVWRSMSPPPWYSSLQLNSYFIGEVVPGPRFFFFCRLCTWGSSRAAIRSHLHKLGVVQVWIRKQQLSACPFTPALLRPNLLTHPVNWSMHHTQSCQTGSAVSLVAI